MDRLWAPWRSVYIGKGPGSDCIFCDKLHAEQDEEYYVVERGDKTFVLMNIFPYQNGHLMVAPKRHVGDIEELDDKESFELLKKHSAWSKCCAQLSGTRTVLISV